MSKSLRTAALIVGAVALAATAVGAAGSIGLLGATTATAGATAATASTFATIASIATVAQFAAAGLSAAAALTAKKPTAAGGGSQTEFSADPQAGVPYAIGRTGTKGNIIFRAASDGWALKDTPNDLNDIVTIFTGAGPIDSFESFTSDNVAISFDANGNAIGEFRDKMFQRRQLGLCPEPSALTVQAGYSARPTAWTSNHKLSGMAAAIWRLRYDSKQRFFQNGVPSPMWVAKWVKVYDPRRDSTYPGGVGGHRANDEATWQWSENPYLHALTWCIGRHQNGKRVMGLGASLDQIIVSDFVEGAGIAEANGWTIGGVVYSRPDTKWNTLKAMLQAGAGEPLRVGARIGCLINTPRVSLATIKARDINGDARLVAMQPIRARLNVVTPRYRSEAHNWEIVPAAPIRVAAHIAEDGGERSKEIEYSLVQNANQAAALARYDIENTREYGPVTLPLRPEWLNYKAGDCVTLDLPEAAGQKMLIMKRTIDPATAGVTFELRSETDGKHAFALGQTGTPPPTASVSPYDPSVPIPSDEDWTAVGLILDGPGVSTAAIVVTGRVGNPSADAVMFEYRVYTGTTLPEEGWAGASLESPTTVRKEIIGLKPDTQYEVAIRYRVRGVIGERLILGAVTTPAGSVSWPVVTGPGRPENNATVGAPSGTDVGGRPAEDIVAGLEVNAFGIIAQALRQDDLAAITDARTFVAGQDVSTYLLTFRNEQTGENSAINSRFEVLGAKTEDLTGSISDLRTAQIEAGQVIVQRLQEVQAENAGLTTSVTTLQEAVINPDGSGYGKFMLRANAAGSIVGLYGTADGEIGRLSFVADELEVASESGGVSTKILNYADGRWTFAGTIYAQKVVELAIGSKEIALDGIRRSYGVELAANLAVPLTLNQRIRVLSVGVTKQNASSTIYISSMMRPRPAVDYACQFQFGRTTGGVDAVLDTVWFWAPNATISGLNSLRLPVTFLRSFYGIPSGVHTFWVDIIAFGGGNSASYLEAGSNIDIEERFR